MRRSTYVAVSIPRVFRDFHSFLKVFFFFLFPGFFGRGGGGEGTFGG